MRSWHCGDPRKSKFVHHDQKAQTSERWSLDLQLSWGARHVDAVIAQLGVAICGLAPNNATSGIEEIQRRIVVKGPSPTRGEFAVATPMLRGVSARLSIFDLAGRRIATMLVPSGTNVVWFGLDQSGHAVGGGVYLYRLELGKLRKDGRVVVVR